MQYTPQHAFRSQRNKANVLAVPEEKRSKTSFKFKEQPKQTMTAAIIPDSSFYNHHSSEVLLWAQPAPGKQWQHAVDPSIGPARQ